MQNATTFPHHFQIGYTPLVASILSIEKTKITNANGTINNAVVSCQK